MNTQKKILLIVLTILLIGTIGSIANFGPGRFLPRVSPVGALACPPPVTPPPVPAQGGCLTVSLDSGTTLTATPGTTCAVPAGQQGVCDTTIEATQTYTKTFRVGAILNATATQKATSTTGCVTTPNPPPPLIQCGVFGWQFGIVYDTTMVVPAGDPSTLCTAYSDCGEKTVWFGSQLSPGTVNWAGALAGAGVATSVITIQPEDPVTHTQEILVAFTFLSPAPPVVIGARTVLANVAFELIGKGNPIFSIPSKDVIFTDQAGGVIPGIIAAPLTPACSPLPPAGSTYIGGQCGQFTGLITNDPPHASFTSTHTGTSYTFTSTSTDTDVGDTLTYVWDFGDKSLPLGTSATVTHDYGLGLGGSKAAPGSFIVSLRATDSLGATGTARDTAGAVIANKQPSHTSNTLALVELGPTAAFTFNPASPSAGATVSLDGSSSTFPDEPLLHGTAPLGGTLLSNADLNLGFVDANANLVWDPGESVVYDATPDGMYDVGDIVIAGPTPVVGAPINCGNGFCLGAADPKLTFVDVGGVPGIWDTTKAVIFDTNGNSIYDGIKTYSWNFGDSSTAGTGAKPTHIYNPTVTTTFTVTLTVTDNLGGTSIVSHGVTVTPAATPHTTTTTVSCTPSTVAINQATNCTATVTDTSGAGATAPTGTVNFTPSGTCTLGTPTTNSASCPVSITPSAAGSLTITATYVPGTDTTHSASSGTTSVTVTARTTTTSVSCTSPVNAGSSTTCTATVTDTSTGTAITPIGTVSFTSSAGASGTFTGSPCTLAGAGSSATCIATYVPTSTTPRTDTITANYVPDANHAASGGTFSLSVTILAHPTTTTLVCTSPVVVNQASTCTATVTDTSTSGATSPLGTVTFSGNAIVFFDFTTCNLVAGTTGIATCSVHATLTPAPGGSSYTTVLSASYGGDPTHNISSNTFTITVNSRTTSTSITCTTPVTLPGMSTCTVTITDTDVGTRATPGASFTLITSSTGTFSGQCVPNGTGATATCQVIYTPTVVGPHRITANFPGDGKHLGSSGFFDITVNPSPKAFTSTTLVCITPIILNSASTCTATVTDTSTTGATSPSGTVTFSDGLGHGTFDSTTCTLVAGTPGVAACSVHFTITYAAQPSDVTASYVGDSTHNSSVSSVFSITVNLRTSSTTITCTSPVALPSSSTCTVTITDTSAAGTPITPGANFSLITSLTGTFSGQCVPTGTGATATCTVIYTPTVVGAHRITANFPGDVAHLASSGFFDITVSSAVLHTTTTVITCNPTSVAVGQPSLCVATVTDTSTTGATIPTGMVTFTPGGPCTLQAATAPTATCSVTISPINLTPLSVTAVYGGDSSHSGSTSNTVNLTITARATTTSVTCVPAAVNIGVATTCNVTVTDTDVGGFIPPMGQVTVTSSGAGTFIGSPCNLAGTTAATTCQVTYTPTGTAPRTDKLTATYAPATTHLAGNGAFSLSITQNLVPPTVSFTEDRTTAFRGQSITLTITSVAGTGTISSVKVDWGDLAIDTLPGTATTASHSYTTLGSFIVTVTVTDSNSLSASATATKTVINQLPTVTFTEDKTTATTGTPITLTITAADPDGTVTSITVNWGDNTPIDTLAGTATTDTHTYTKAGSYTVTVAVIDNNSGKTTAPTATKTITDRPPVASFTESMTSAPTGTSISFDASASTDPDGTITTYAWNFGDSTTGTGVTVSHAYTKAGSYTVTLTVTDDSGSTSQSTGTKTITDRAPTASFSFTPANPLVGQTVTFDATASTDPDGTIASYAWNFGDSTTGTGVATTHAYTTAGSFTVTLTVTDDARVTGVASLTVPVTQPVTNPGHAKLVEWRADAKFNSDNLRRNSTQVLRAFGANDGTVAVNVYVQFAITSPDGSTHTIYTKVVSLATGQRINGRLDSRFSATFNPLPGRTSVTATIYYSSVSSTIGDVSFNPDTASAKSFSFNAPGTRMDDFNFNDDITSTSQSFDANINNQANIDLISRIDVTVRQPDGTTKTYTSDSLLLHSGQSGDITFVIPLTGPDGTYCFTSTLKYGIDSNHNGALDNNEVLGTGGTQRDCFFADTDDAPAGTALAAPATLTHVFTDDD